MHELTIEQLEIELQQAEAAEEAARNKARDLKQTIAFKKSRFKIGDNVTYDGAGKVWSVARIGAFGWGGTRIEPRYFGRVLKKDGTPGLRVDEMYQNPRDLRLARADEIPGAKR